MGLITPPIHKVELTETIDTINQRLADRYGLFENGEANWRVAWSDYTEIRVDNHEKWAPAGIYLGSEYGPKEVPKYNYIQHRYVLEKVVGVSNPELTTRTSYEPIWTFEDSKGNPLPPKWEAIQFICDQLLKNVNDRSQYAKYKEEEIETNTKEGLEMRYKRLFDELYGNETDVTDALSVGSGVGYTGPSKIIR